MRALDNCTCTSVAPRKKKECRSVHKETFPSILCHSAVAPVYSRGKKGADLAQKLVRRFFFPQAPPINGLCSNTVELARAVSATPPSMVTMIPVLGGPECVRVVCFTAAAAPDLAFGVNVHIVFLHDECCGAARASGPGTRHLSIA